MPEQALQVAFEIKTACDEISRRLLRWHWEHKPGAHSLGALLDHVAQRQQESPDYYDRMPDLSGKNSWQQLDTTICMRVLLDPEKDAAKPLDLLGNTRHPGAARRACNAVRTARNEAAHAADAQDAAQAALLFHEAIESLEEGYADTAFRENELAQYYREAENFTEYQQIFGFGQKTNIDLPGESRTDSLIYTLDTTSQLSLATNAFGQNFNTTMIQLGTAFCSLVNGGKLYQPRVVSKITDQNGNTIQDISPTLLRETVSKTTSDTLKQYMYSTVTSGTGNTAKVDGYSMGGKTGTAQKVPRDGVNYLVSFIGFAPVDDPQLMIYCFVDEPNSQDQPHSTFAQNIVREILEEVLPYMNIYPDEKKTGVNKGYDVTGSKDSSQYTGKHNGTKSRNEKKKKN